MNIINNEIPDYLVSKHGYFGVSYYLIFPEDKKITKNFLKVVDINYEDKSSRHLERNFSFIHSVMPRGQDNFLGCVRFNGETGREFKERKNSYLYKSNFFIKEIRLNNKKNGLVITCYLKPSTSISQVLKGLKISINNWYFRYKINHFKYPELWLIKENTREDSNTLKDKILSNHRPYFSVFDIKKIK